MPEKNLEKTRKAIEAYIVILQWRTVDSFKTLTVKKVLGQNCFSGKCVYLNNKSNQENFWKKKTGEQFVDHSLLLDPTQALF